jgi:MerR family transcriptional regulator, redox-sensitive transcriptional activator SoxR
VQDSLLIGELAQRAGLATSAIRYYESIGLLPEPYRVSGQRRYGEETLRRLEFIAAAQQAGFTLREIAELSDGFDVRSLAQRKLPEVKAELKRARDRKRWLDAASECTCGSPDECTLFDGESALEIVHVDGCRRADAPA